jgi:L-threonylcarbamoyladenylate synthase
VTAASRIADGGVIVLPTETVYGLACRPTAEGVARIFEIKSRPPDKNVQLLVPDASWLDRMGRPTDAARTLAAAFWPGPLTLVVAPSDDAPTALSAAGTIGIRVPSHPVALEVLELTGPLAASSANRSGDPTPPTAAEIAALFGSSVDAVLDGGRIEGTGSTVVDATGLEIAVLRAGPITDAHLRDALKTPERGPI